MRKKRVLIVDDDRSLSRLAGVILEGAGIYEVMIVNESTRALKAALRFKPDMMLLDVDMPDKSGDDIAREAAADAHLKDIPILFLTGVLDREEAATQQLENGGVKFLSKPIDPSLLLTSVADLIPQSAAA